MKSFVFTLLAASDVGDHGDLLPPPCSFVPSLVKVFGFPITAITRDVGDYGDLNYLASGTSTHTLTA